MIKLSILIATIEERVASFKTLYNEFCIQIYSHNLYNENEVELIFISDNKESSIGAKRQQLLEKATGEYIVFFDDDDIPESYYVSEIMNALYHKPDSVGFKIKMTINGKCDKLCCHSFKYKKWEEKKFGFDYIRGITHFNPVLRHLALQIGFKDFRFGEDYDYSMRLMALVRNEVYINKVMFHYRYSNAIEHKKKYGIK